MRFTALVLALPLFAYDPQTVTPEDMEAVQRFEKDFYETVNVEFPELDIEKVYRFCWENRTERMGDWEENLKVEGLAGARQATTGAEDAAEATNAYVGIQMRYALYDRKEELDKNRQIRTQKKAIMGAVKEYFGAKAELEVIEMERRLVDLKEVRFKARQKSGVGSTDERIANLEKLVGLRKRRDDNLLKLQEAREMLKSYIMAQKIPELEKML